MTAVYIVCGFVTYCAGSALLAVITGRAIRLAKQARSRETAVDDTIARILADAEGEQ